MFRKFFIGSLLLLAAGGSLVIFSPVYGQSAKEEITRQLDAAAGVKGANVGKYTDPRQTAARIIQVLLTLVGTIFFGLTVYAGYKWMTAGGNEEDVTAAKTTLRNAVIGLLITVAAYGITIAAKNIALGEPISTDATAGGYSLEEGVEAAGEKLFGD